jgi:hypothetical protein
MTITKNYSDSNGGDFQRATGRFLNDDTAVAIAIELGFRPRYFQLVNLTDRITHEWYEGMASGTTVKTAADGVRTLDTADVAIQVCATTSHTRARPPSLTARPPTSRASSPRMA